MHYHRVLDRMVTVTLETRRKHKNYRARKSAGNQRAKVWQNYELEKAKLHNIMTVLNYGTCLWTPLHLQNWPPEPKRLSATSKGIVGSIRKSACDNVKIEQVRIFMDKRGLESKLRQTMNWQV